VRLSLKKTEKKVRERTKQISTGKRDTKTLSVETTFNAGGQNLFLEKALSNPREGFYTSWELIDLKKAAGLSSGLLVLTREPVISWGKKKKTQRQNA